MHRFGDSARRVGSSAFRFGVAAGRVGSSAQRVGLRAHCFRFSVRTASGLPSAGWFFHSSGWSSGSLLPLFGTHRFGVAAGRVRSSAFRFGDCPRRVGLRAHCFRFSARTASGLPLGGLVFTPSVSEIALGGLAFGLTASAFRHAPLRKLPSAGWPSGSLLPLFGMRRSAPPHRRSEDRRSTPTRHLFHFKHLSQHVNLPHRTP